MKKLLFLLALSFNILHSQEISNEEYILYAQILDRYNYSSSRFELGIPSKYRGYLSGPENTSKAEISKIRIRKKFKVSKLEETLLNYRKNRNLDRENAFDPVKSYKTDIYCSPIYFKTSTEAFVVVIALDTFFPNPSYSLIRATKDDDLYWHLEDFNYYYN